MKKLPNTKEIRAIVNGFTVDVPEDEIDDVTSDIESLIDEVHQFGYDEGIDQGRYDYESETPQVNEEKVGVDYCVDAFSECHTLVDFQDKLKEITLRSYNFM